MAFVTQNRHVRALERESRFFVKCDRECGRAESLHGVAAFALSVVRRRGELAAVLGFVAIGAFRESDLVTSRSARRRMALITR